MSEGRLAGLVLGWGLLPRQHPDAAVLHMRSAKAAREWALAFLARWRYQIDPSTTIMRLRRAADLFCLRTCSVNLPEQPRWPMI